MMNVASRRMSRYFCWSSTSLMMSMISGTVYPWVAPTDPFGAMNVNDPVGLMLLASGMPVRSLSHSNTWFQGLFWNSNLCRFSPTAGLEAGSPIGAGGAAAGGWGGCAAAGPAAAASTAAAASHRVRALVLAVCACIRAVPAEVDEERRARRGGGAGSLYAAGRGRNSAA